jgi:protein phosphatase
VAVGAVSHTGHVRPNNEDHYVVARTSRALNVLATSLSSGSVPESFEEAAYALAVADGLGRAVAGEVASSLALTRGLELAMRSTRWFLRADEQETENFVERVRGYFREIDRSLAEVARTRPGLSGMGTTLTFAYTVGFDAFVFHVGHSRAYVMRDGDLWQVTRDQTVAQALADAGDLPPEAVSSHHMRHVLTHAIGSDRSGAQAAIHQLRLQAGDRLLLCTDGLTDMVEAPAIAAVLARRDPPQPAAEALIERALACGGRDNITVIVADYSTPTDGASA